MYMYSTRDDSVEGPKQESHLHVKDAEGMYIGERGEAAVRANESLGAHEITLPLPYWATA